MRAKSCTVCGRRTDGSSRCALHQKQLGTRARSCIVCSRPTAGNYCPEHDPETNEAARLERQPWRAGYRESAYRTNRQRRYDFAGGRCEECGVPVAPGEWECDHLTALSDGGSNDLTNLRVRCIPCHRAKTTTARRNR